MSPFNHKYPVKGHISKSSHILRCWLGLQPKNLGEHSSPQIGADVLFLKLEDGFIGIELIIIY